MTRNTPPTSAEQQALDLLDTVRPSPWVQRALAGELPAKDLTAHHTPGFTSDDQRAGTRGKRKSLKAQLTQRAANRKRDKAIGR